MRESISSFLVVEGTSLVGSKEREGATLIAHYVLETFRNVLGTSGTFQKRS